MRLLRTINNLRAAMDWINNFQMPPTLDFDRGPKHMRINTFLLQWGQSVNTSTAQTTVVFPIPFGAAPSVHLTHVEAKNRYCPAVVSVSAVSFVLRRADDFGTGAKTNWLAIGQVSTGADAGTGVAALEADVQTTDQTSEVAP